MNAVDMAQMLGRHFRVLSASDPSIEMGQGEVIAFCQSPTIVLRDADGTLTHHSIDLPREELPAPVACTQCGQVYQRCRGCGERIIFVPKQGFGNSGEWRHLEPPVNNVGHHLPHPELVIT